MRRTGRGAGVDRSSEQERLGEEGGVARLEGEPDAVERGGKILVLVARVERFVEVGGKTLEHAREHRRVARLDRVGERQHASRLQDARELGGDTGPHGRRQFMEQEHTRHRVHAGVGHREAFGHRLDDPGAAAPARLGEVGGREVQAGDVRAGKGGAQIDEEGA